MLNPKRRFEKMLDEKGREINDDPPAVKVIKSKRMNEVEALRKMITREVYNQTAEQLIESDEDRRDFDVWDPNDSDVGPMTPYEIIELDELNEFAEWEERRRYDLENNRKDVLETGDKTDSNRERRQSEHGDGRQGAGNSGRDSRQDNGDKRRREDLNEYGKLQSQ
jgi:hypothetical protein